MIAAAMGLLIGIEDTFGFKVLVILSCTVIFATSVYLGLEKGIKRLSNLNTIIALAFLAFILIAGPTVFILKNDNEQSRFNGPKLHSNEHMDRSAH